VALTAKEFNFDECRPVGLYEKLVVVTWKLGTFKALA
jgi:hypothetical protein